MILVVGATGDLGGRVARRLMASGQQVRALVRPGTPGDGLRGAGVDVVPGDLTQAETLTDSCAAVETVVMTATAISRILAGARRPSIHDVDERGALALVEAAESAGVSRFVYVSYAGVEAGIAFPLERAKVAVEERLRASTMQTCLVRPDAFQEVHLAPVGRFDVRAGKVMVIGRGQGVRRWVATEDVAALVAAVAVEPNPPVIVEFGGPEAMTRLQAVTVAERLSGRKMKVKRMPAGAARLGIRLLQRPQPALASVFGLGLLLDMDAQWNDGPLQDRGIEPRSATAWLQEQAAQK